MSSSYCRREQRLDFLAATTHITCAEDALGVIHTARKHPSQPEVIALALDERQGHTVLIAGGAVDPDGVIAVVEWLGNDLVRSGRPGELVVATVRPDIGPLPGDGDRWMEASAIAEDFGCELLEWFVITDDVVWCPRDLLAEPPRW